MTICACIGAINGEPACPCIMKSGQYRPDYIRFKELEIYKPIGKINVFLETKSSNEDYYKTNEWAKNEMD
jgi:hypothetical protein